MELIRRFNLIFLAGRLTCVFVVWTATIALAQPMEEEKLPRIDQMTLPSVEELLTQRPRDWIVLITDEVLVVESLVPRPNTLEAIQKTIAAKQELRRKAEGAQRDVLTREIAELDYLIVALPSDQTSPEFRLQTRRIKQILHHEDLMLRRISMLARDGEVTPALELLTRLQRTSPNWNGVKEAGEAVISADAANRLNAGKSEAALALLEELQGRNPSYPGLADRYGQAIRLLVRDALDQQNYLKSQFFLNRLQQRMPNHPVARELEAVLTEASRMKLQEANAASQRGDNRQATLLTEQAAVIWPRTSELRAASRQHLERYQRLHVGVVGQPWGSPAYPVAGDAELRRRMLMELPLFEVDRIRDGVAYYRTRFFDEWEPMDLGREVRITLSQDRQPFEMQALVATPDVVAPILNALNPSHPDFDERLDGLIESINVISPVEFSLRFRRVPPRLEPLLARISLTGETDDLQALAPLTDPGGFRILESDADQICYVRKLPEPEGLARYRVAEIVEHNYDSYERAVQALERGEVSMIPGLPDWIVRRMQNEAESRRKYFFQQEAIPVTHLLQFNPASPSLRVREFRTALAYAVDRERILRDVVLQDPEMRHGRLVTTPFLSSSPGRNVLISARRYDLASAVAMLLAARKQLPQMPPLTIVVAPCPVAQRAADEMVQAWRRIGVEINVVVASDTPPESWDILYRTIKMTEPVIEMWPFLTFQEQANVDGLKAYPDWLKQDLVELDGISDQSVAIESLQSVHRRLWEDTAFVPLWELDQFVVIRKNVQNFPNRMMRCYDQIDRWTVDPWFQTELP